MCTVKGDSTSLALIIPTLENISPIHSVPVHSSAAAASNNQVRQVASTAGTACRCSLRLKFCTVDALCDSNSTEFKLFSVVLYKLLVQ